jgi:hypothetical protein
MEITIKLSVEQWNQILDMLGDQSIKRAMPLINAIMEQAKPQLPADALPATNGVVMKE